MSDDSKPSEAKHEPVVVTTTFADDDFARAFPGSNPQQDGGQSFLGQVSVQAGDRLCDAHYGIYTAHWNPATRATEAHERDALGKLGVSCGQMGEVQFTNDIIARWHVGAEVSRYDHSLSPKIQDTVHSLIGGRDMGPLFAASPVKESVQAGVAAMVQLRREGKIGPFEIVGGQHIAVKKGTDSQAFSGGVEAAIGQGLAGLPEALPQANPEAGPHMITGAPNTAQAGDWSVAAWLNLHYIAKNEFYRGDHAPATEGKSVMVMGQYAATNSVIVGGYCQNYSNPSDPDHGLGRGPKRVSTCGVQVTKTW